MSVWARWRRPLKIAARVAAVLAAVLAVLAGVIWFWLWKVGALHDPADDILTEAQTIELIDSLRPQGSYEQARQRLTASAVSIAEQISAAVPGQTWYVDTNPYSLQISRRGLSCNELSGSIALHPTPDTIFFGRPFTGEEFAVAARIVATEAAKYGVTTQDSMFNNTNMRDFAALGNGYDFNIGQINGATLDITGTCFLKQHVLDQPAGVMPTPGPRTTEPTTPPATAPPR